MPRRSISWAALLAMGGLALWVAPKMLGLARTKELPAPPDEQVISDPHRPPSLDEYAEVTEHGTLRVRSDWAKALYAQADDPGIYRKGSSPDTRPFDNSDPEMRQLMASVYAVGGCAQPGQPCKPALDLMIQGGDRLARYLIRQLEESERGGWPDNDTYLSYIAYTRSETGFRFVRDRVLHRDTLSPFDGRWAVHALSRTARPEAIDVALPLLEDSDPAIRDAAVNVLRYVSIETNHLRPDVLAKLRDLRDRRWVNAKSAMVAIEEHFGLASSEPVSPE